MAVILNSAILNLDHLGFSHLSIFSQTHSHLPRLVPNICTKKLHLFILTQLDDCSYLEICHASILPVCTKKTSLIHSDSNFMMAAILNFCHLGFSDFAQNRASLIDSKSTWWWQPSWTLPSWIQTLPYWIQTPCYLLSDSLKNTLPPLCTLTQSNSIWLKLIHGSLYLMMTAILNWTILDSAICTKKFHSCILTLIDDGIHLEFCHLGFSHLHKTNCHSCILTLIDDGSHLEFCHLGFSHFAQNKFHLFILTQLDDGSHLEFCHVGFRHCHLGFKYLVNFSQIHSKTLFLHSVCDSK